MSERQLHFLFAKLINLLRIRLFILFLKLCFEFFLKQPSYFSANQAFRTYPKMPTLFANRAFNPVHFPSLFGLGPAVRQNFSGRTNVTIIVGIVFEMALVEGLGLFSGCLGT